MPYQHIDAVALWAEAQLAALGTGDLPQYGTVAWRGLPADDPRRVGGILVAAEQWRRRRVEQQWLDDLADSDPERWWDEITAEAETEARSTLRRLRASTTPGWAEISARRRERKPVHQLRATTGWPPITLPGRPGRHRHLIDGRQVDLDDTRREAAA